MSLRVIIAIAALAGVLIAVPAHADTKGDLDAARQELASKQADLDALTLQWQQTETAYAQAQDAARGAGTDRLLQAQLTKVQQQFDSGAGRLHVRWGVAIGALLRSESIADFADRLQYTQNIVQGDADLATEVAVKSERLRREEARLPRRPRAGEGRRPAPGPERGVGCPSRELKAAVNELGQKFQAERAGTGRATAAGGGGSFPVTGSGAIQTCPVAGPSFVDSFGGRGPAAAPTRAST